MILTKLMKGELQDAELLLAGKYGEMFNESS